MKVMASANSNAFNEIFMIYVYLTVLLAPLVAVVSLLRN